MEDKYMQFVKKNDLLTELYIYGDIRKPDFFDVLFGEMDAGRRDAYSFKEELEKVDTPNLLVRINSYGGSVSEALAIYNLLSTSKLNVTTIVDGFACSAASVIFMAGQNRIVPKSGLLMIHNASSYAEGDYRSLKKASEDLEKIQQPSVDIYVSKTGMKEEEVRELMDNETWINSKLAFELGFSTIEEESADAHQAMEADFIVRMVEQMESLKNDNKDLTEKLKKYENQNSLEILDKKEESWNSFFKKGTV